MIVLPPNEWMHVELWGGAVMPKLCEPSGARPFVTQCDLAATGRYRSRATTGEQDGSNGGSLRVGRANGLSGRCCDVLRPPIRTLGSVIDIEGLVQDGPNDGSYVAPCGMERVRDSDVRQDRYRYPTMTL